MKFRDAAEFDGAQKSAPGVKFVSECGQWRVAIDRLNGHEWYVWQRLRRPDPVHDPRGWGFVRRAEWGYFVSKEGAMAVAMVLDAMPATLSGRVAEAMISDAFRSAVTRLLFVGLAAASMAARRIMRVDSAHGDKTTHDSEPMGL